jgi:uncharacterized protein YecA (UPF0149 family)
MERDEEERAEFIDTINALPDETYADESGFEEDYSRTYGYSKRGERVYGDVHGTRFGRLLGLSMITMNSPQVSRSRDT